MKKKIDYLLIAATVCLLVIGVLFVYSSSLGSDGTLLSYEYLRQIIFIVTGLGLFILMQLFSLKDLRKYVVTIYIVALCLLILTLFFGEVRNGARSWLGFWNLGIQISEFMKIATILLLAKFIEGKHQENINKKTIYQSCLFLGIPFILILLQPDMGTALVYIPILLAVFYISGMSGARVFFFIFVGIIAIVTLIFLFIFYSTDISEVGNVDIFSLSWPNVMVYLMVLLGVIVLSSIGKGLTHFKIFFRGTLYLSTTIFFGTIFAILASRVLKPYQLQRLLIFINPDSDPQNSGWHILQSINAIGSGGIFGTGFLEGSQSKLQYLPMTKTDFIFSMIGEELGFLGTTIVIFLYTILMWRILITGYRSNNLFSAICCGGIFAIFFTHFTVNVGMTLGLMPVTGIPLMLLSYGGSSLWTALISLGIVHKIYYSESQMRGSVVYTL